MKYPHLKSELNKVKKFVAKKNKAIYYIDLIKGGYSIKVEYMTKDVETVIDTFSALKSEFPDKRVRLLKPIPLVRPFGWYAVRIWVK